MRSPARLHEGIRKATRAVLWADVLLTAVLAAILTIHWVVPARTVAADDRRSPVAASPRQWYVAIDQVRAAVTGKAVFRTSRAVREKVVDELGRYELKGASISGTERKAYIRDTKMKRMLVKRPGDTLGPYEVVEVNEQGVTVRRGAETLVLSKG